MTGSYVKWDFMDVVILLIYARVGISSKYFLVVSVISGAAAKLW